MTQLLDINEVYADGVIEAHEIEFEKENTMGEFKGWGSTTRENKNKTITEKLDGTKVKGAKTTPVNIPGLEDVLFNRAASAEGIIVWNNETKTRTKILLENDAFHKWEANNA